MGRGRFLGLPVGGWTEGEMRRRWGYVGFGVGVGGLRGEFAVL